MSPDLPPRLVSARAVESIDASSAGSDRSLPRTSQRAGALALVSALGALGGTVIGSLLLGSLLTQSPGGFHWRVDIVFSLIFGGGFGALVGAVGAPNMGWLFFRHVPLGCAIVVTGVGTAVGAGVGLASFGAPVLGGCLGFAVAGAALRLYPKPANVALQLTNERD